jgi:hypothetical protein
MDREQSEQEFDLMRDSTLWTARTKGGDCLNQEFGDLHQEQTRRSLQGMIQEKVILNRDVL